MPKILEPYFVSQGPPSDRLLDKHRSGSSSRNLRLGSRPPASIRLFVSPRALLVPFFFPAARVQGAGSSGPSQGTQKGLGKSDRGLGSARYAGWRLPMSPVQPRTVALRVLAETGLRPFQAARGGRSECGKPQAGPSSLPSRPPGIPHSFGSQR